MNQIGESTVGKILVFHFQVLGLWHPETFSIIYTIYSAFLYIIFSLIYVSCMCMNFFFVTNVTDTTHSMYMSLTCVALVFKSVNFLWYNRHMQSNLKIVNNFPLKNDYEIHFVHNHLRVYRNMWLCYYLIINATGIAGYLNCLFTLPRQLPFRAWYPFDWQNNETIYWLLYAYQVLGMIVLANMNIAIEVFPGYLMYMATLKMEILALRLESMEKNVNESLNKNVNANDRRQQKAICDLIDCIKLHQHILRFINQIENDFSIAYFAQICFSGIVICCVTYALTTTSPQEGLAEISFYVFFLVALVTQIFLPCFLGNEIIFTSETLTCSAFNSAWYEMPGAYRKLLLLLMERLKKRSQIIIGKLFPLSLDTFTSIIYFAYRLYAVISNTKLN